MKVVILAGGLGSRLSEETIIKPKPMVEIGTHPIIWHIMKIYASQGHNDFIILLGYKGYYIKEYFFNYFLHNNDVTIDLARNSIEIHNSHAEPWRVTLLETGAYNMTGSRIKQARPYLNEETFFLTYGDGLSNINLESELDFHRSHGRLLTMATVQPEGRFGVVDINDEFGVKRFHEKPPGDGGWINGGFFICEPGIFDYISEELDCVFEKDPLENLAKDDQLYAYQHKGFWMCMDTLRDKVKLNELWDQGSAKWKIWT